VHIDWWTLALQGTNFLVLVWLLQHFLYKPVLAVIQRRQQATDRLLADARTTQHAAEGLRHELEQQQAILVRDRASAIEAARSDAETERKRLLEQATAEAARILADGRQAADRQRELIAKDVNDRAGQLALAIARRLLERAPNTAVEPFLERICARLQALSVEAKAALVGSMASGHGIELVTAAALAESEQASCLHRLAETLDAKPHVVFRVDPALIAGIELHFPEAVMRSSWADDLDHITAALAQDDRSGKHA